MSSDTTPRAGAKMIRRIVPALLLVASSLLAQQAPPPLYTDLGTHHKVVGTRVPLAQQYFDQGLRLVYGFNHAEAIRSFTRATELDPACAMCWWGIAYAYGPHVNAGMDSASGVKAYEAAQKALSLSRGASPWQRAYEEIVRQLERVIARNPEHPGACHYYIHAVEAVNPQLAIPCAERLARLMPGVGHMVHMPAHIYIRVGRYNDAAASNVHAIHTDEMFIEGQKPVSVYSLAYYPHNIHFLAFASTMAGRSAQAIEAARTLKSKVNLEVARQVAMLQEMMPYYVLTLTTFGRWDDVLAEPLPPSDIRMPLAMAYYARGVAYAAKGQPAEARTALDTVKAIDAATPADAPAKTSVSIAVHALMGEIATRSGKYDEGIAHFREALKIEDAGLYFEPPKWYYPIRESLGAALLNAGQSAQAAAVYREDLKRFPENGWSLFGLAAALRAEGKSAEAAAVDQRFSKAWSAADVRLTASRF